MAYFFLYLFSIFSLSQAAVLIRWTPLPIEIMGWWRMLGASLILILFAGWRGQFKILKCYTQSQWLLIITAAILFFAHLWTFFYAAQTTKISHCTIIFATNPIFTAIGARVFFKERLNKALIPANLLAFSGVFILISKSFALDSQMISGDLSALLSSTLFSASLLTSKHLRKSTPNFIFTGTKYFITALLFGVLSGFSSSSFWPDNYQAWIGIGALIVFPTLLGHSLFNWLIDKLDINWMSTGKLLEPIFAASVAMLIFYEPITYQAKLSFFLTGLALLLLFLNKK